ncbi:MAG: hypothetical protein J6Q44_00740 [Alphaproteobacteria bacterium]|nr:hypothetical protein [Alphaproteobacteria bacterium]
MANLLDFSSEMKRVLVFLANLLVCVGVANAAVRDGTAVSRAKSDKNVSQTQARTATVVKRSEPRTSVLSARTPTNSNKARTATMRTAVARSAKNVSNSRNMTPIVARAANNATGALSSTRTGAEYEQCKNTYFSCMDQFCMLKNDDYRRCSCNDRVFELGQVRDVLEQAGEKLTVFTESLDVVGMTAAQALAMRTQSEGEAALTDDSSASKALLQAIMNSIRGGDSTVGGKYSDLNSINISFDTVNAFGMVDAGQAIAAYNGNALYSAVYPQCREAVRADCNDASLQRAITAYLMAIEQDCNTVQTAIEKTQQQMKAAVREGSAMLDLARVENRQKHNSSDITTCINEVEAAILSEQVCGADYHKCLDNGQYIDISTGKPIVGVEDFYKLEQMLVFSDGIEAADQKLSKNSSNRAFVQNFENRVKKFAQGALDKCVENADTVWSEYLDKAMLSIYYAQKAKVSEIKQGCFDYVANCYMNGDKAITAAMSELTGASGVVLQPDKVALNSQMCSEYVESCNNMFDGNIIAQYIDNIQNTDTLAACRAVVKQCFDKYGGTNYENFYYPYSGLFPASSERAPDWFALYEVKADGTKEYKSECAKQLTKITACSDPEMIKNAFGGFDVINAIRRTDDYKQYVYSLPTDQGEGDAEPTTYVRYGLLDDGNKLEHRHLRSTGVATEVYNQIISVLSTQCMNLQGRFMEYHLFDDGAYMEDNFCQANFADSRYAKDPNGSLVDLYKIGTKEDMCPRDYNLGVATQSWGACLCWENGARRSKWGKSAKCVAALPLKGAGDATCATNATLDEATATLTEDDWCTAGVISDFNQVCAIGMSKGYLYSGVDQPKYCLSGGVAFEDLPKGID